MTIHPTEPAQVASTTAAETLLEMAAVVRTLFGVGAGVRAEAGPPVASSAPPPSPSLNTAAVTVPAPTAIPVPGLAGPAGDRHSLTMLQELAFLDD